MVFITVGAWSRPLNNHQLIMIPYGWCWLLYSLWNRNEKHVRNCEPYVYGQMLMLSTSFNLSHHSSSHRDSWWMRLQKSCDNQPVDGYKPLLELSHYKRYAPLQQVASRLQLPCPVTLLHLHMTAVLVNRDLTGAAIPTTKRTQPTTSNKPFRTQRTLPTQPSQPSQPSQPTHPPFTHGQT